MAPARIVLRREENWCGLRPGDEVAIDAPREARSRFQFVAAVTNESSGELWIEVRGGRPGEFRDRSFRPEQIFDPMSRRSGRLSGPSLLDAPRLPLS